MKEVRQHLHETVYDGRKTGWNCKCPLQEDTELSSWGHPQATSHIWFLLLSIQEPSYLRLRFFKEYLKRHLFPGAKFFPVYLALSFSDNISQNYETLKLETLEALNIIFSQTEVMFSNVWSWVRSKQFQVYHMVVQPYTATYHQDL